MESHITQADFVPLLAMIASWPVQTQPILATHTFPGGHLQENGVSLFPFCAKIVESQAWQLLLKLTELVDVQIQERYVLLQLIAEDRQLQALPLSGPLANRPASQVIQVELIRMPVAPQSHLPVIVFHMRPFELQVQEKGVFLETALILEVQGIHLKMLPVTCIALLEPQSHTRSALFQVSSFAVQVQAKLFFLLFVKVLLLPQIKHVLLFAAIMEVVGLQMQASAMESHE